MNRGRQGRPLATGYAGPGEAKVWVKFKYSSTLGVQILTSYNVSRVVRNAGGDYTVYFLQPFLNPHFVVFVGVGGNGPSGQAEYLTGISSSDPGLSNAKRIVTRVTGGGGLEDVETHFVAFGDA